MYCFTEHVVFVIDIQTSNLICVGGHVEIVCFLQVLPQVALDLVISKWEEF